MGDMYCHETAENIENVTFFNSSESTFKENKHFTSTYISIYPSAFLAVSSLERTSRAIFLPRSILWTD